MGLGDNPNQRVTAREARSRLMGAPKQGKPMKLDRTNQHTPLISEEFAQRRRSGMISWGAAIGMLTEQLGFCFPAYRRLIS
jgi:hypothetical protein